VLDALRRLGASSVNLLLTRAEFASLELARSRAQLMRWLGLALAIAVLALLALIAASAALVLLWWERGGPLTLVALALLYALAALGLGRGLRRELQSAPPVLAETLAEFSRDRDAMLGRAAAGEADAPPAAGASQ
jgi:uncharacterized membrane protein YqjE